jgi:transcriptional regulator with GAF, ATPase, and Fis domain
LSQEPTAEPAIRAPLRPLTIGRGIEEGPMDERGADLPDQDSGLWSAVEHLVRLFRLRRADEPALVSAVCAEAVRLVDTVQHAGVILAVDRRHVDIVATTGPIPQRLDEFQQREGDGPCLAAARSQEVVRLEDVATDQRWPSFASLAADAGVGSMLCLPLHVDTTTFGTLSLYADTPHAIKDGAEPVARVLAVLAAITLSESRSRLHLERALQSRDLIGQAKGIIMHARRVTADEAFALLVRRSQETNTKLVEVAESVVTTGIA